MPCLVNIRAPYIAQICKISTVYIIASEHGIYCINFLFLFCTATSITIFSTRQSLYKARIVMNHVCVICNIDCSPLINIFKIPLFNLIFTWRMIYFMVLSLMAGMLALLSLYHFTQYSHSSSDRIWMQNSHLTPVSIFKFYALLSSILF